MESSTCLSKVEIEEYLGKLPAGFEFAPTYEQLINDYLLKKFVHGIKPAFDAFPFINILDYTPNQLQEWFIPRNSHNGEWYFFSKREYKHEKSKIQMLRQLSNNLGFWKKQSKHSVGTIHESLGTKNILDFYSLHNSESNKTGWIMHEFIAPNHDNLISVYKIFMSRPATKRKRELEEDVLHCLHIKAARSTQDDQAALSAQEQLCTGSMIINCQYSQDHQMTTTLSTGQSQQQGLALPQDHQQHLNSPMMMSNGSCQRIISDQEIVSTSPSKLQQQLISYTTTNYDIDHETMGALAELEQTLQQEDDYSWKLISPEENINSFMKDLASELSSTHLVMNREEQPAQMHQDQVLLQPNCHLRNQTKEYIDVEKYFDNTTGSNPQHKLNSSRSWTNDDFEQLFAGG